MKCVKSWFKASVECATGCGCRCAELALSLSYLHRGSASTVVELFDGDSEENVDSLVKGQRNKSASINLVSGDDSASESSSDNYENEGSEEEEESGSDDSELELKGRYESYFGNSRDYSYLHEGWESD